MPQVPDNSQIFDYRDLVLITSLRVLIYLQANVAPEKRGAIW